MKSSANYVCVIALICGTSGISAQPIEVRSKRIDCKDREIARTIEKLGAGDEKKFIEFVGDKLISGECKIVPAAQKKAENEESVTEAVAIKFFQVFFAGLWWVTKMMAKAIWYMIVG